MKNKAQLKIQQMSFMLIAVTLFFVLVGMFVLVIKFSDLKRDATELCEENARLLVSKLANSPEFSCGEAFGSLKTNCIDADKVMVLKENIKKYEGFWGVSNLEIRKLYPETPEIVCNLGNFPDCSTIKVISGEVTGTYISNYITLCRKETFDDSFYDKCEVAVIMLSYEYGEKC